MKQRLHHNSINGNDVKTNLNKPLKEKPYRAHPVP
jgi:hypothetical protein